jgi:hypothetical protein
MQITANKIIRRIYGHGRGWCFTPKDFVDLGNSEAIRINLHRLEKKGIIRRLARGIYDYPKKHQSIGVLSPNAQKIANAISIRDAIRLQSSGAYAANLLGLSEQIPAIIVLLTDGPGRRLKIGHQEILLRRTTPRNLATAGKTSGLIIQALKHIGKKQIARYHIVHLQNTLDDSAKSQLKKDSIYAPQWMHPIIDNITKDSNAAIR